MFNRGVNPAYWQRVASLTAGLLHKDINGNINDYLNDNWMPLLSDEITELPFVQYHASGHPNFIPNPIQIKDFNQRLNIIKHCYSLHNKRIPFPEDFAEEVYNIPQEDTTKLLARDLTVIVYGKSKWNLLKHHIDNGAIIISFNGAVAYDSATFKRVIVIPQNSQNRNYTYQEIYQIGQVI